MATSDTIGSFLQSDYEWPAKATIYPTGHVSHNAIGDDDIPGVGYSVAT